MLSIALPAMLWFTACADREAPLAAKSGPTISSLRVLPAALTMLPGQSAQLQAQANDATGQAVGGAEFRFSSGAPDLIVVDDFGRVAARGPAGRATVTVRSAGVRTEVAVLVRPGPPAELRRLSGASIQLSQAAAATSPVVVTLLDAAGNPISGAAIQFSVGTAPYAHESTTDDSGSASWVPRLPVPATATLIRVATALEPRLETSIEVVAADTPDPSPEQ